MGIWFLSLLINSGCNRDLVEYDSNDLKISIEKGKSGCIISFVSRHQHQKSAPDCNLD